MDVIIIIFAVLQSMAISLGVGGSTLAVLNFFVALKDGKIDEHERNLMGVVYIVLRVAMALILLSTLSLAIFSALETSMSTYLTSFKLAIWTLIFMLFFNAILMTKHWISSTFGPAIQAASWYTLGVLAALLPLNLHNFSYIQFLIGYALAILLATILINLVLMKLLTPNKK